VKVCLVTREGVAVAAEVAVAVVATGEVVIEAAAAVTIAGEAGDAVTSHRVVAVAMATFKVDAEARWLFVEVHRATAVAD
jgi:hypothetical protein